MHFPFIISTLFLTFSRENIPNYTIEIVSFPWNLTTVTSTCTNGLEKKIELNAVIWVIDQTELVKGYTNAENAGPKRKV